MRRAAPALLLAAAAAAWAEPAPKDVFPALIPAELQRRMVDDSRRLLVEVGLELKPFDPSEGLEDDDRYYSQASTLFSSVKNFPKLGQKMRLQGVVAGPDGSVVADAFDLDWSHLASVTVADASGKEHPAELEGVSSRGRLVWFRAPTLRGALPALHKAALKLGDPYFESYIMQNEEDEPDIEVEPRRVYERVWFEAKPRPRKTAERFFMHRDHSGHAVFDDQGRWVGIMPMTRLLEPDGSLIVDPGDLRRRLVTREDLEQRHKRVADRLSARQPVVRLRFRQIKSAQETEYSYGEDGDDRLKERSDPGIPLGGRLVFVPVALKPSLVKRLETVSVELGGKAGAGRFIGVVRELAGYLVEAPTALQPIAEGAPADPPDDETLLAAHPRWRAGALQVRPFLTYFDGMDRGYQDVYYRRMPGKPQEGSVIATLQGEPFAVVVAQRLHQSAEPDARDRYSFGEPDEIHAPYRLDRLAEYFRDPLARIDPLLVPLPPEQEKRRVWLGVVTQDVTYDLAKELGIDRDTHDATRGQLVTFVYPESPAAKLGVAPGDLILKFRELEKKDDVSVPAAGIRQKPNDDTPWWIWWFEQETPLSETLSKFRPGAKVELTWSHGHKEKTASLVLQEGPPTLASAPKLKETRLGLTVKPLTVDVRHALRWSAVKGGLLVHDVESGSAAEVAELDVMELLLEADGAALEEPEDLVKAVDRASQRHAESMRLRVRFLDQTRYVDVKLAKNGNGTSTAGAKVEPEAPEDKGVTLEPDLPEE